LKFFSLSKIHLFQKPILSLCINPNRPVFAGRFMIKKPHTVRPAAEKANRLGLMKKRQPVGKAAWVVNIYGHMPRGTEYLDRPHGKNAKPWLA
jgi:hypothetical protein